MNELLNLRNLSFHNTQSMTVADLEIARKAIPKKLVGLAEVRPMLNPVFIATIESYSRNMLISLHLQWGFKRKSMTGQTTLF